MTPELRKAILHTCEYITDNSTVAAYHGGRRAGITPEAVARIRRGYSTNGRPRNPARDLSTPYLPPSCAVGEEAIGASHETRNRASYADGCDRLAALIERYIAKSARLHMDKIPRDMRERAVDVVKYRLGWR